MGLHEADVHDCHERAHLLARFRVLVSGTTLFWRGQLDTPVTAPRILKFGGGALRSGEGFVAAARIVQASTGPRVVVASAMRGVTDRLMHAQERVLEDDAHVALTVDELRSRHLDALAIAAPRDTQAAPVLEGLLLRLERLLYGLAAAKQSTPRLHDLIQSFGERMAVPILAAALQAHNQKAVALDAEEAGLATLGPFGHADPDMGQLRKNVNARLGSLLAGGVVPVVTGYYGVDAEGHPTLFGRGGSDYVASVLGDALDASVIELWKEVAGFMSADPQWVPDALPLTHLGYQEAAELSQFGAKVLHPRAVEPAQARGIPIHVRSVAKPDSPGTQVSATQGQGLSSVACKQGVAVIRLRGPSIAALPGVAHAVFGALRPGPINVLAAANSQTVLSLALDEGDVPRAREALDKVSHPAIRSIEILPGRSLLCVVGPGLARVGVAAKVLASVGSAGVDVDMVSLASSDIAFDFVVPHHQQRDAVKAVHRVIMEAA